MAEVTNELMYELLKSIHQRMDRVDAILGEVKQEIVSIRLSVMGIHTDITTSTASCHVMTNASIA
ncbi:hypothetical protein [Mesorhizobium sp. CAU 1741]|uniref:hypothetical protein n=1 Tax=Mesorhizobium sp. CAU 1741 TaxID=3140366 RepID=UPI00325BE087